MTYKVLDLFSGIGGFSLGLERTGGFETVAFCEIEKFPQKVLAKHWPGVPIYEDVRELTAERLRADGIIPNIITGGFPCQDISVAGNQKGIGEGTRSGLWSECARLLGELRPDYAIFENVTALLSGKTRTWFCECGWVGTNGKVILDGDELSSLYVCQDCERHLSDKTTRYDDDYWFSRVLRDISQVGYDAEWHCIPASELGAHHHRDRVWIIAYPRLSEPQGWEQSKKTNHRGSAEGIPQGGEPASPCNDVAYAKQVGLQGSKFERVKFSERERLGNKGTDVPNTDSINGRGESQLPTSTEGKSRDKPSGCGGKQGNVANTNIDIQQSDNRGKTSQKSKRKEESILPVGSGYMADTERKRQQGQGKYVKPLLTEALENWKAINAESGCISGIWATEPELGRVANGIRDRSHRLKGLGNAVVPAIPELIGRAILQAH
jgi:DNA (cytosine-5)-methyltransferase 1